jgi:hypothetical protein
MNDLAEIFFLFLSLLTPLIITDFISSLQMSSLFNQYLQLASSSTTSFVNKNTRCAHSTSNAHAGAQ